MKRLLTYGFGSLFLLLAVGCKSDPKPNNSQTPPPAAITVPRFDRDTALAYVGRQVAFGPRVVNTEAHDACRAWLVATLQRFGADVVEQKFTAKAYTGTMLQGTNIIGKYNPAASRRILLAAHWDSRHIADSPLSVTDRDQPVLGADDGASGVGVLLEVARQIQANPIDLGIDIVFFDAEDYGQSDGQSADSWALGAQHFSRNLPYSSANRPEYGILLDMVGARGARFGREEVSMVYAGDVMNKVWKLAQSMGYGNYFVEDKVGPVTDDHYFVNTIARIPMIDIINRPPDTETGFVAHWHTQEDTMDKIDRNTLRAVGQVVLAVIYREFEQTL